MVIAVGVLVPLLGIATVGPWWLLPLALLTAVVVSAAGYARWGRGEDGHGRHLRLGSQVVALSAAAAISGIGVAIIGPLVLLAVADTVRYSGSRAGRLALGWGVTGIVGHQVVVAAMGWPTVAAGGGGHALAAMHALLVVLVGNRVVRLATQGEAAARDVVEAQHRVEAVLAGASDLTLIISDGVVTYQSPSAARPLGYGPHDLLGQAYLELIHPDDRRRAIDFVQELLTEPGSSGLLQCRLRGADGDHVPVESSCRNLLDDPTVAGFVVTARDVSEREQLQAQLTHRAFHDDLTGLANRALLLDRLEHTGLRVGRNGHRYAVLYVDLDGFKPINDTYGHVVGDAVLREIAQRLLLATRRSDTVARLGGDEFAVLIEEQHEAVDAGRVAGRILEHLRRPLTVDGLSMQVTASIGIAYDEDGEAPADVLRDADIAMYLAKREGKDRFEVFEPRMHVAVVERLHLESDLQRALESDELVVHYQPIVTLREQRIVGVEALVRWEHPERGTVSPGTFIPLAEETGQIVTLGRHVLRSACRQLARWRTEVPGADELTVSVNVSARQFHVGDLVGDVWTALTEAGLPAAALTLELTESALVTDADRTLRVLEELRALGVRLAIDDFGTGYSSLAYLHRFPVDVLKIDRSFVTSVVNGQQSPALARAIVDLGRSLELTTVAEGIERDVELDQFRELDCTLGQGFLFARPADAATTGAALREAFGASIDLRGDPPSPAVRPHGDVASPRVANR